MSPILHAAVARVLDTPNSWGNYNFGSSKKIRAIYCLGSLGAKSLSLVLVGVASLRQAFWPASCSPKGTRFWVALGRFPRTEWTPLSNMCSVISRPGSAERSEGGEE